MIKYCLLSLLLMSYVWAIQGESFDDVLIDDEKIEAKPPKPPKPTNCTKTFNDSTGKVSFSGLDINHACLWTLIPKNVTLISLFFDALLLADGDIVTVTNHADGKPIHQFTNGQKDGFILFTGTESLSIGLNTSSTKVQRHFSVQYQSQTCTFAVYPHTETIRQPEYGLNYTEVGCKIHYDLSNDPGLQYAFSFDKFNLSSGSIIQVDGAQGGDVSFSGSDIPQDLLSKDKIVLFDITLEPNSTDEFVLRGWELNAECAAYMVIDGKENIASPAPQQLTDNLLTECLWQVKNKNPKEALGLEFSGVNLLDNNDILTVVDGQHLHSSPFLQVTQSNADLVKKQVIRSSSSELIISFKATSFNSNFSAKVFSAGSGIYLKNSGTLKASPSGTAEFENSTVFLLEVNEGQNVVVDFSVFVLDAPASLDIYDDFSMDSKMIASLHGNVWYPIISPTSKMMIKATKFMTGSFEATFNGTNTGCMHMSPGVSDSYSLFGNCDASCGWIIPPIASDNDLFLDLQYVQLELEDRIQVLKLDAKKSVVADITSTTKQVPQFSLSAIEGAYVNITRGACPKKEDKIILVARTNYLPACTQNFTISKYDVLNLTSPEYPNYYPLHSDCIMRVTRASADQMLYLTFNELDLAPDHCLNMTEITKTGTKTFILFGNQMPEDIVVAGDIIVKFNAIGCNSTKNAATSYATARGFHITVRSTDCGGSSTNKTDTLTMTANKTMCVYKVSVPAKESDGSVNTIVYDDEADKVGNYHLVVHDGSSLRDGVIDNSSDSGIWSKTNSLIFFYSQVDLSKPSSQVTIKYNVKNCNKSMQCQNGICMHPDWLCNGANNCGDFTDERNCQPAKIPEKTPEGISSVVFGVCVCLFFVFGVVSAILIQKLFKKYRGYQRFQDISVIE